MQAVIALKAERNPGPEALICDLPLLERVVLTALRAGCSRVLLLCPPSVDSAALLATAQASRFAGACIQVIELDQTFDPTDADHWRPLEERLEQRFLWIPGGYIPHRDALAELFARARLTPGANVCVFFPGGPSQSIFDAPAIVLKSSLIDGCPDALERVIRREAPGVSLHGSEAVTYAERELVRRSGKVTDGIYSRFNRLLCRPAVRWLSWTGVTPNVVTFGGLAVALLAGMSFARGTWINDVIGAVLFFVSGLFDEIDGMLARIKFQESAFGCWLETMVDYATYIAIFVGITVGASHRYGPTYKALGIALLLGSLLSFWVISIQRRLAAPPDRPSEYSRRYLTALEKDERNPISASIRQLQFLTRKGVLMHYLLVFAALGILPLFLTLAALGANIAWMVTIYFNVRLFSGHSRAVAQTQNAIAAEGKR